MGGSSRCESSQEWVKDTPVNKQLAAIAAFAKRMQSALPHALAPGTELRRVLDRLAAVQNMLAEALAPGAALRAFFESPHADARELGRQSEADKAYADPSSGGVGIRRGEFDLAIPALGGPKYTEYAGSSQQRMPSWEHS